MTESSDNLGIPVPASPAISDSADDQRAFGQPDPRPRYMMTVAYDGAGFHGWQKQEPPDAPPLRTVAGEIEQHLRRLMGQQINLVGASRTDAGVHARGQVAHFNAETRIPVTRMAEALNNRLPHDIDVQSIIEAPKGFDAISGAVNKQYRYRIFNAQRRPLERRNHVWHGWVELDADRMQDAAQRLVGKHDFAGFATAGHGRTTTVRTIFDCHVEKDHPELHIVVQGSGFLYNMVRIIAGTLIEVGRGLFDPEQVDIALKSGDRRDAGPTLPPTGLWLEWIRY